MLIAAFLVILASFVIIMIGISISAAWLSEGAFLILVGALLYSPLRNRMLGKWNHKRKKESGSRD